VLELRLSLARDSYVAGEAVTLAVAVQNKGAAPVGVPAIHDQDDATVTYTVRGPQLAPPLRFTLRSANDVGQAVGQPTPLPPGERLEGEVRLDKLLRLETPGRYELSAELVLPGVPPARSNEVAFGWVHAEPTSAAVGRDAAASNRPMVWIPWLHAGATLFEGIHKRGRWKFEAQATVRLKEGLREAREVLAIDANYDRGGGEVRWRAWRTDAGLAAMPTTRPLVVEAPVPAGARVATPLLMTAKGELDAFLLGPDGTELLRLPRPRTHREAEPPTTAWRGPPRPAPPAAATAALGLDDVRHLVVLDAAGTLAALSLAEPRAARWRLAPPAPPPLPGSGLAVRAPDRGVGGEAAWVGSQDGGACLVRVSLGPEPAVVEVTPLFALDPADGVRSAAAAYDPRPGELPPAWAVLLASGVVRHPRAAAPQRLRGTPREPLALVLAEDPNLLVVDGAGRLGLEELSRS
jgi:hypothetical protein